ncbi:MAG: ABC transporter ATP-binding protein [Bacteroidia bacterium]
MVTIQNINKSFGRMEVLKNISFNIAENESVAILGPNGSGKSTLMKIILGLVIPDKGDVFIDNISIKENTLYKKNIGYLPQTVKLPENIKVKEVIQLLENIRGEKSNADELSELFEISNYRDYPIRNLSGGTKQKLNLIISLMFKNKLLILDEPTVGLDPVSRIIFKYQIEKEKQKNKSIILCTHIISEVETLCERMIFLLEGKVYYDGTIRSLKEHYNEPSLEKIIANIISNTKHV